LAYEDIGLAKKGEGGNLIDEGQTYRDGDMPVNVDGGLKAKGHPVGATGASMTVEAVKQLRGDAGERQVDGAEMALTHNVGGIGQYCYVNIYSR
ncbi:MAG: thiolase domain-containing protein, partial [Thermoplasmata archaeon]|nr:thiolase domain-containing protein [Thermoplasmata archaeon]